MKKAAIGGLDYVRNVGVSALYGVLCPGGARNAGALGTSGFPYLCNSSAEASEHSRNDS